MTDTQKFVRYGFGEDFGLKTRSLNFTTEAMKAEEAIEVVKLIKSYNDFEGEKVAEAIKQIANLWKSEHQQVTFEFGREGSPVLYVSFPYWLKQDKKLNETERNYRIDLSKAILQGTKPDELDRSIRADIRAWWD